MVLQFLLVLLAASVILSVSQPSGAVSPPASVAVHGTEFQIVDSDGRMRSGADLVGAEITIEDATGPHRLRIDETRLDADGIVRLYRFSGQNAATRTWTNLCQPGPDGIAMGFPLPGWFTETGRYMPDTARFTITCTGGAIGKCVRFGYRPWENARAVDLYRACVRMVRADYCGDGRGWTRNGMAIEFHDLLGVVPEEEAPGMSLEAAWGPDGAACVAHVRVPENGSLEDVINACPRLAGKTGAACRPSFDMEGERPLIINSSFDR